MNDFVILTLQTGVREIAQRARTYTLYAGFLCLISLTHMVPLALQQE